VGAKNDVQGFSPSHGGRRPSGSQDARHAKEI